ncbi:hypothetical protein RIF29_29377 [Crotalaria pallida]|uniref:Uncharacterized protein n=1 Tax=Crotalaria pallida TaxID=3830 RepID=A0AAN9EL95_CROPI
MASIRKERGVLKLVHPGRHVEVHREPIRASEVMKRNPRHSLTRPDVFDFPWIVVNPESVLFPGSVFLIVPNRKIYDLLKAKGQCNYLPTFLEQNQSPNNNIHVHQQHKQDSPPSTSCYGMSSKNQRHKQCIKGLFERREKKGEGREVEGKLHRRLDKPFLPLSSSLSSFSQTSSNCLSKIMPLDHRQNVCNYGWDEKSQQNILEVCPNGDNTEDASLATEKRSQNQSYVEKWPKLNCCEDTKKKIDEQELLEEMSFESIPYEAKQYYQNNRKGKETESPKNYYNLEFVSNYEPLTMLKSSLRRPDSIRKSLNLKVSFNIPINEEEQ